jgi:arylsulfatase A-like enzyme
MEPSSATGASSADRRAPTGRWAQREPGAPPGRRPNFVVILTDQHRADGLGCAWPGWRAGTCDLRTPHLDRLARGGVRLARAFVNNPLCMPSRATLLTGLAPRGHGVRTNGINLNPLLPTVPGALAAAGYRTHCVGKIHARLFGLPKGLDPETLDPADYPESAWMWQRGRIDALPLPYYGFQSVDFVGGHGSGVWGDYANWLRREHPREAPLLAREAGVPPACGAPYTWRMPLPPELHYTTWIADRTIAFLERRAAPAARGEPFMVWASFPDPHAPFCAPEPWYSMYDRRRVPPPVRRDGELDDLPPHFRAAYDGGLFHSGHHGSVKIPDEQLREITAVTYGMISFVDQQVGRILDALDRLGLAEDTVVLFTADHGELLGDHWLTHKGPFHVDGLLNVPCIWRWPGHFSGGRVDDAPVSHLDVAPTLLELAGVPVPERVPTAPPAATVAPRAMAPWPGRSRVPVLTGRSTPRRGRPARRDGVLVENDEDWIGLRLRTLVTDTHQLTVYVGDDGEQPYGELFDRRADPGQLQNLWHRAGASRLKNRLRARLLAELVRTDSRLPRRLADA